jgi:hypothetical protein
VWIETDFVPPTAPRVHPIKVLKGPRQVGKTALLVRGGTHRAVYLDDLATRELATPDPHFFSINCRARCCSMKRRSRLRYFPSSNVEWTPSAAANPRMPSTCG